MGLTGSQFANEVQKEHPKQQVPLKPLLQVLPNTHMVIAPGCMHPAEPPTLLKTPPAKVVDAKTTGNPDGIVTC